MASKRRELSWKGMHILFLTLTVICACMADDYFLYSFEDDVGVSSSAPVLKLLQKRQADKEMKEKENSTSEAFKATGTSSDPTAATAATNATMSSPEPDLPDAPRVMDYDGENITVTNITRDHHRYYNSTTFPTTGMDFWMDMENATIHDMLSTSHRRAATVVLSFDFPFYGHLVKNITIATGGFLYTGEYVHSWLAATQYIAPLMANFDTSIANYSTIKHLDNGTAFAVQWDNVALQENPSGGNFTFQAILLKSGDIIFAYKEVPINVTSIVEDAHPVKIGVSDAYIIDRTIFFVRRKTIYEYHKVDKKTDSVTSGSAIYFTALPTCVSLNSCETCINNSIDFECVWCPTANRCSDGMDRHRQDWLVKGCDKFSVDKDGNCSMPPPTPSIPLAPVTDIPAPSTISPTRFPSTTVSPTTKPWSDMDSVVTVATTKTPKDSTPLLPGARTNIDDDAEEHQSSNVSSVVGILFLVAMLVGLSGWIFYAYRNPHTPSGQCFIRYRPSQWRWRSGEAHYTAAAIHM